MTTTITISAHDWVAEQLLKAARMLLGEQGNVGWIDFAPDENAEMLIGKYNAQLAKLDTTRGVLFLVSTWGDSPFNAASYIVVDREHYEVIADVSILILVETLMTRDDDPSFDELVVLTVEAGRESVKALRVKPVGKAAPAPTAAVPKATPTPTKSMGPNGYMVIGLARIDDRLTHGQVATRWTRGTNVSHITVVSDEVAADTVRKTLLTQVAPPGVTTHVVDVAKMIRVYNNPKYTGEHMMLLFTNPADMERPVEGGVEITSVNVGDMASRQSRTQVNSAVSIDEKDIKTFKKLNTHDVELEVHKVSTDPKLKMMDLISKIDKQRTMLVITQFSHLSLA